MISKLSFVNLLTFTLLRKLISPLKDTADVSASRRYRDAESRLGERRSDRRPILREVWTRRYEAEPAYNR